MPLSPRNANTMWMLHFLSHLKDGGTAGFVMATASCPTAIRLRLEVRKALVERDTSDCIVQLTGQLFANTQIPCSLWFLSKNRKGGNGGYREANRRSAVHRGRNWGRSSQDRENRRSSTADEVGRVATTYTAIQSRFWSASKASLDSAQ